MMFTVVGIRNKDSSQPFIDFINANCPRDAINTVIEEQEEEDIEIICVFSGYRYPLKTD